jgi:arylsulfatase A-like enzyme
MAAFSLFRSRHTGPRPNIVLLLLDQFRNDARGVHPIFAELKRRGCVFSEAITYAPYTLASMHATMTGLYGRQTGVDAYTKSDQYDGRNCYSLPQYLQDAGYHTRGYTFSSILVPHAGFDSLKIVPEADESGILDSHFAELQAAFTQTRPFFSYLHYGEIHHAVVRNVLRKYQPFDAEYFGNRDLNLSRYREYAQAAAEHTARLVERLDALDAARNTLLIVMADHGGGVGEKPGEKAYGVFTYDYSIKTWLYLVHPTLLPHGVEHHVQVRTIDLLPTIIDIVGLAPSKKHKQPGGRSLMPIIRGEESEDRIAFTETGGVEGPHPSPDHPNVKSLRSGGWKLIYNTATNGFELYDLRNDPGETRNLYATHPDKARELWIQMSEYL